MPHFTHAGLFDFTPRFKQPCFVSSESKLHVDLHPCFSLFLQKFWTCLFGPLLLSPIKFPLTLLLLLLESSGQSLLFLHIRIEGLRKCTGNLTLDLVLWIEEGIHHALQFLHFADLRGSFTPCNPFGCLLY